MVKYYYAGSQRLAMRTGGSANTNLKLVLSVIEVWLLGDHLGSTSVTTDYNAANPVTTLYTPLRQPQDPCGARRCPREKAAPIHNTTNGSNGIEYR